MTSVWTTSLFSCQQTKISPNGASGGGGGECLKIIQVQNSSLAGLVEVFLGMARGFDVPAGAVVLSSPSHAAATGTADYASDLICSSGQLRRAFKGGVTVLHGIPFLLGGTCNVPEIRALAEVEHWICRTSTGMDDISAASTAFNGSLRNTPAPAVASGNTSLGFLQRRLAVISYHMSPWVSITLKWLLTQ
jgi:hypothetical protein